MELKFTKMHGCGNDYIYFNCFDYDVSAPEALSVRLSDRHTGVGGDGIVLILPSETADAKMRMFNADGSEGSMCGNAIRCVAKYLYDNGIVVKEHMKIQTRSGVKELRLTVDSGLVSSVCVNMGAIKTKKIRLDGVSAIYADAGNPHCVLFREDIASVNTAVENYEKHEYFPDGVNTEFVELAGRNRLKMRVWERGSGETQACGTGACACAAAAVLMGYCDKGEDISVKLPGGTLIINCTDDAVYMTGGCVKVFEGVIDI